MVFRLFVDFYSFIRRDVILWHPHNHPHIIPSSLKGTSIFTLFSPTPQTLRSPLDKIRKLTLQSYMLFSLIQRLNNILLLNYPFASCKKNKTI